MKQLKSESEKQRDKNIRNIQKSIQNLEKEGYIIEMIQQENLFGKEIINVYAKIISSTGRVWEQKYLFTIK